MSLVYPLRTVIPNTATSRAIPYTLQPPARPKDELGSPLFQTHEQLDKESPAKFALRFKAAAMAFPPSVPVKGIEDFIHAVSVLQRCKRVDPLSETPIGQRSKELCDAKTAALSALRALVASNDQSFVRELETLERRLQCLLVLPRIKIPAPRYHIDQELNSTVWASHVLDDFLFIGPGSEFMQMKLGQPNALPPEAHELRQNAVTQFMSKYNIRFIINVSKELIPGLETDGERDYPFVFSDSHPITCVKEEDLSRIATEDATAIDLQSVLGVMVPMDDLEEFSPEFDRLVQVAAWALELSWRRFASASVRFPSQPPPPACTYTVLAV